MPWLSKIEAVPLEEVKRRKKFCSKKEKVDRKIILYVTAEEKELFFGRSKAKGISTNSYIRSQLQPTVRKLRSLIDGTEKESCN